MLNFAAPTNYYLIMKRTTDRLWQLMAMLAIILCIAACKETDGTDIDKPISTVPVSSSDWQTVPATGGTIEKGDLALSFPSGTFDKDTRVAITEMKNGPLGGGLDASPFYQITMPQSTSKPMKVSIKADKVDGEANIVVYSPGYITMITQETMDSKKEVTTYSNGEYSCTLPAFDASRSKDNTSIFIGLGRIPTGAAATMATRATDESEIIDSVAGVSWRLTIEYGYWERWNKNKQYNKLKGLLPALNVFIKEAIVDITDLGFKVPKGTRLNYKISSFTDLYDKWKKVDQSDGCYFASYISRSFDNIWLKDVLLLNSGNTNKLRQTIIHETLHNFQEYYYPFIISPFATGEWLAMFEMGSVWIEKYRNHGEPSAKFQLNNGGIVNSFTNDFRLGLSSSSSDIKALYGDYGEYGYALGPLLHYCVSKNYRYGFEDKVVESLYSKYWKVLSDGQSVIDVLSNWYTGTFASKTKDHLQDHINNYYLALWKGEVMQEFNIVKMQGDVKGALLDKIEDYEIPSLDEKNTKFSLNGKIYPYGCEGLYFQMYSKDFKDGQLLENEMVIRQDAEKLKTYLLYSDGDHIVQYPYVATADDPIYVSGEELEAWRKKANGYYYFFILTLREEDYLSKSGTIASKESVELRKAESDFEISPNAITAEEGGDQFTVRLLNTSGAALTCDESDYWFNAEIKKLAGGNKENIMLVTVEENNTNRYRTGKVVVKMMVGSKAIEKTLSVAQYGGLQLDQTELTFDVKGGTEIVNILTSMKPITVNLNGCEGWVRIQQDDRKLTITVLENKGMKRNGTIIISGYSEKNIGFSSVKLAISQDGEEPDGYAKVTPTLIEFPAYGGLAIVDTEEDYENTYTTFDPTPTASLMKSWGSGTYSSECYITAAPNNSNKATTDTLVFSYSNNEDTPYAERYKIPVIIKQKAGPADLQDMMKMMKGEWISTEESNPTWQRRLVYNGDGTYTSQQRTRTSESKPWGNWSSVSSHKYKVTSYSQSGNSIRINIVEDGKNETFLAFFPHYVIYYGWYLVKEK